MNVIDMKRDHVVRATAANGTIRAFAVYSRGLVEDARRMHELSRTATAALGRTLTAAAMMGTMTSRLLTVASFRRTMTAASAVSTSVVVRGGMAKAF